MGCFIVQILTGGLPQYQSRGMSFFLIMLLITLLSTLAGQGDAVAGSFKVFPLKLELNSKTKTTLFKITNTGDTPVTVQLETVNWFQNKEGDDKYEATRDIVYFPKIVKVESGQQRIIRIGYRGNDSGSTEKSYRIFAQELPELGDKKGALKFSLRFSVPIFVSSPGTRAKASIVDAALNNGQFNILVKNTGNEHFVVKSIKVNGLGIDGQQLFNAKTGGWYVLPDAKRPFLVKIPENECRLSQKLSFIVETSAGSLVNKVPVDSGQCVAITELDKVNTLSFEQ